MVRLVMGPIMLFLESVTTPKGIERPAAEQAELDRKTAHLVLYQFRTCPFCIRVRRAMKRMSLHIELRDAQLDMAYRNELLQGGGKIKVPCLRITGPGGEERWLYESKDIIAYLQQQSCR